jgi:hypothetical protein
MTLGQKGSDSANLAVGALIDEDFRTAAIFSCCERESFDAASKRWRILPVGPAVARFFFPVSAEAPALAGACR